MTAGLDTATTPVADAGRHGPSSPSSNRSTLPEEIADRLLDLIRAESLRPGDKLPAERDLAAMMHVSRPVLREALRALAIMKVVEIRQGAGTYITALEPQQLVSHLDFVFSKDTVALAQVHRDAAGGGGGQRPAGRGADHAGAGRAPARHSLAELRGARRRRGPVQHPGHRLPRRGVRGGRQLPARPVHEHHQHPGQGQPRAHGRQRARTASARSRDHEAIVAALAAARPRRRRPAMARHLDHVEEALVRATGTAAARRPTRPGRPHP